MQLITRATNSTVVFTLTEKVTLASPIFLFELTATQNGKVKTFIAPDISSYTYRYNKFIITEVASTNLEVLTSGTVNLPDVGEYYYRIFEQTSTTNLNPINTTSLLEIGIIRVLATPTATSTYSSNPTEFNTYIMPD